MANTTFSGPIRSKNGLKNIIENTTTGAISNEMTVLICCYSYSC